MIADVHSSIQQQLEEIMWVQEGTNKWQLLPHLPTGFRNRIISQPACSQDTYRHLEASTYIAPRTFLTARSRGGIISILRFRELLRIAFEETVKLALRGDSLFFVPTLLQCNRAGHNTCVHHRNTCLQHGLSKKALKTRGAIWQVPFFSWLHLAWSNEPSAKLKLRPHKNRNGETYSCKSAKSPSRGRLEIRESNKNGKQKGNRMETRKNRSRNRTSTKTKQIRTTTIQTRNEKKQAKAKMNKGSNKETQKRRNKQRTKIVL